MTRLTGPGGAVVDVTWKDTPTRHIDVGGVTFAYRELGADAGVPLVFLHHLTAVLDDWDPRVIDGIAATRRVITFDNRGIGASGGSVPHSVEAMARDAVAFIRALGLDQVDLLGFSLGGGVAQVIALSEPELVRKVILAGTGPAGGGGINQVTKIAVKAYVRGAVTLKDPKHYLFFTGTPAGRLATPARTFPSMQPLPLTDRAELAAHGRALVRQLTLERVDVLPPPADQLELAVDVPERLLEDLAAA